MDNENVKEVQQCKGCADRDQNILAYKNKVITAENNKIILKEKYDMLMNIHEDLLEKLVNK